MISSIYLRMKIAPQNLKPATIDEIYYHHVVLI
jgi:hypothetical protein